MIVGAVNHFREAVIRVVVRGPSGQSEVDGIVDTGFDGALSLSPRLVSTLGLPFRSRGRAVLADGNEIIFDIYEAVVVWNGKPLRVPVDEADTDPLVGMGLLYGHELTIEVVAGGRVAIVLLR